jgi:uncharacterized protein YabE (DUF348 family)
MAFLACFFISVVLFVGLSANTIGAADAKVVHLSIDGEQRTVPTRATTVGELLERLNVRLSEQDIVEPAREMPIYDDNFVINIYKARPITIDDGKVRKTLITAQKSPRLIANQAGYTTYPEDDIEFARPDDFLREGVLGEEVNVDYATPMTINLYGNIFALRTQAETLGELLQERNIKILEGDTLQPQGLETPITPNLPVFIVRTGTQIATVEEEIPPPVETLTDPNMAVGSTLVRDGGKPGKRVVTYEILTSNGVETGRKVLQEVIITEPIKKVVLTGTRSLFADYNAEGIPARVYCGSPKQRNWKNIKVQNAAVGRTLAAERGWTGAEWDALLELFACESSWNEIAGNPFSGAYGIPQALPASKMSSAGSDYLTNPKTQIIWGLDYVTRVYGTPSRALAKHYSVNWY